MRVLVTGAAGFVGGHLMRALADARHTVVALDRIAPAGPGGDMPAFTGVTADIMDAAAIEAAVASHRPAAAVHLAATASVAAAAATPEQAYTVNVRGTFNFLRAFRRHAPQARLLVVGTAQVYGNRARTEPLREDAVMEPGNAYAESKAWADWMALLFADRLGMAVMTARPHNHTGPGQSTAYAAPAFAAQIAAVARGRAALPLAVGNLDSCRDISDVRDVARAYVLLLERGRRGRAYNIAAGRRVAMRELLENFCRLAGVAPETRVDPARWRPTDESPPLDTAALRADTGWEPRIPLEKTVRDVWEAVWNTSGER